MNKKLTILAATVIMIFILPLCAYAGEKLYVASPSGEISLRIAPDEQSEEITKVPACSKVELLEKEKTWGKVIFDNKCGWINLSFTVGSYNDAAATTGSDSVKDVMIEASGGKTTLHNVPTSDVKLGSTVVATVPNSTILNIKRETSNGWGLVSMNTKYAWVKMVDTKKYGSYGDDKLSEYGIFYVYVASPRGNGAPLLKNKGEGKLLNIPDCTRLTVRKKSGNYGYVSYNGINGWIDLSLTTDSYSNALVNTGFAVNKEYNVVLQEDETAIYSQPTYDIESGTYEVERVENGETVFILRRTESGWSMLSKNGIRGWILTDALTEETDAHVELPQMCEPYDIYILTKELKGIKLYPEPDSQEDSICTIPECAKMTVVAKSGASLYLKNDYAAGWTPLSEFAESFEEAVKGHKSIKHYYYRIDDETTLRSLPIYSDLCGSEELLTVPVGKEFVVTKIVTTGDRKWGLTEIDGIRGFINLNCAEKSLSLFLRILIVLICIFIATVLVFVFIKIRRKRK